MNLKTIDKILLAAASACGIVTAAIATNQIHASKQIAGVIAVAGMICAAVARSILPDAGQGPPSSPGSGPGPFPFDTRPPSAISVVALIGLACALASCAAGQAKAVGRAELACAEQAEPDLLAAVTQALATGGLEDPAAWVAPMTQLALSRGPDEVKCAVAALLTKAPAPVQPASSSPTNPPAAAERLAVVFSAPDSLNAVTRPRAVEWLATH